MDFFKRNKVQGFSILHTALILLQGLTHFRDVSQSCGCNLGVANLHMDRF
jgi:hypothetical protein